MRIFPISHLDFDYYFQSELKDPVEASIGTVIPKALGKKPLEVDESEHLYETMTDEKNIGCTKRKNVAYDMVFAMPKAASVLWALSGDDQANEILRAHGEAVENSIRYLELTESWTKVAGMVVGAEEIRAFEFRHLLSRNQDPHVHSHVVLLNGANYGGKERALNSARVYKIQPVLEIIYRHELARYLYKSIGFGLRGYILGTLQLGNLDENVVAEFSTRRREVIDRSKNFGTTARARQISALSTRGPKTQIDLGELRVKWHTQARSLGLCPQLDGRGPLLDFHLTPVFVSPVSDIFHSEFLYRLGSSKSIDMWEALASTCESLLDSSRRSEGIQSPKRSGVLNLGLDDRGETYMLELKALGGGALSQMVSAKIKEYFESFDSSSNEEIVRENQCLSSDSALLKRDVGRTVILGRTQKERAHLESLSSDSTEANLLLGGVNLQMGSFSRLAFSQIEAACGTKMIRRLVRRSQSLTPPSPDDSKLEGAVAPLMTLDDVSAHLSAEVFLTRKSAVASALWETLHALQNGSPVAIHVFKNISEAQSFRQEIVSMAQSNANSVLDTKWGKVLVGELVAVLPVQKRSYLFRIDGPCRTGANINLVSAKGEVLEIGDGFDGKILPLAATKSDSVAISRLTEYASIISSVRIFDTPEVERFDAIRSWSFETRLKTSLEAPEFSSIRLLLMARLGRLENLENLSLGSIDENAVAKSFNPAKGVELGKSVRREIDRSSRVRLLLMQRGITFRDELREIVRSKGELGVSRDIFLEKLHHRSPSDFGRELW